MSCIIYTHPLSDRKLLAYAFCDHSIFVTLTSRLVLNLRVEHERSAQAGFTTLGSVGAETGHAPMSFASRVLASFTVDMDCEEVVMDSEEGYDMTASVTSRDAAPTKF